MDHNTKPVFVYLVLLSAMLIWGFSFLAIKDVVETVPIFILRFTAATITGVMLTQLDRRPRRAAVIGIEEG